MPITCWPQYVVRQDCFRPCHSLKRCQGVGRPVLEAALDRQNIEENLGGPYPQWRERHLRTRCCAWAALGRALGPETWAGDVGAWFLRRATWNWAQKILSRPRTGAGKSGKSPWRTHVESAAHLTKPCPVAPIFEPIPASRPICLSILISRHCCFEWVLLQAVTENWPQLKHLCEPSTITT